MKGKVLGSVVLAGIICLSSIAFQMKKLHLATKGRQSHYTERGLVSGNRIIGVERRLRRPQF